MLITASATIIGSIGAAAVMYAVNDIGNNITMKNLQKNGIDPNSKEGKKKIRNGKIISAVVGAAAGVTYYEGMHYYVNTVVNGNNCLEEVRCQLQLENESNPPVVTEVIDGVEITTF